MVRPKPTNEGILTIVSVDFPSKRTFDYWTLNKSGDFYALVELFDDSGQDRSGQNLFFDTGILRATEALLHCAGLYKALGVEPNAHVEMTVRYGGLRGRILTDASPSRRNFPRYRNLHEDEVSVPPITFALGAAEMEIVDLVKKLCEPLFVIFDFAIFGDDIYEQIVTNFVNGKVT